MEPTIKMVIDVESILNSKIIFYIESPGKILKLREILFDIGFADFKVVPTKGRIYDLPPCSIGLNLQDFSDINRVPVDRELVSKLIAGMSSEYIFILTDDDIEGELIASDILDIAKQKGYKFGLDAFRLKFQSLTKDSILSAIESPSEIDSGIVRGALARRVFDRLIGYSISSNDYQQYAGGLHGRAGRIISPAISILNSNGFNRFSHSYSFLRLRADDGLMWDVRATSNVRANHKVIAEILSSLRPPVVKLISLSEYPDKALPLSGGKALYSLSRATGAGVVDTARSMQRLYQSGRISYPRSDSSFIPPDMSLLIDRMARDHGVKGFNPNHLVQKSSNEKNFMVQGAHHGICPLVSPSSLYSNMESLSLDDQLLMLLARNNIRSGQEDRMVIETRGELDLNSTKNKEWIQLKHEYGIDIKINRFETYLRGSALRKEFNDDVFELGSFCGCRLSPSSGYFVERNDLMVLRLLLENNMGRPSTLPIHAHKISELFLTDSGEINSLGLSSLLLAKYYCPGLSSSKNSLEIEKSLYEIGSNGDINLSVNEALNIADINIKLITSNKSFGSFINDYEAEFNDNLN